MNKLDFISFIIFSKVKLEVTKTQTIPDLPKTILFRNSELLYIFSSKSKISVFPFFQEDLEQNIKNLAFQSFPFPCAVLKSAQNISLAMKIEDCITMCKDLISKKTDFELQEYILSEGNSVKVIRVFLSGLCTSAKVFENLTCFDDFASNEKKFLKSECKTSENVIISYSASGLKKKALEIQRLITSMVDKKYTTTKLSLDFIKKGDFWYFISVNSCNFKPSTKKTQNLPALPNSSHTKSRNQGSQTLRTKLIVPKDYLNKQELEDRVDKLIEKSSAPALKHMSYKK